MSLKFSRLSLLITGLSSLILSGCFTPPYNHFKPDRPVAKTTAKVAAVGTALGYITGGSATVGGIIGGVAGATYALNKETPRGIIKDLSKKDIQYVQYGDRRQLIIPTDKYFMFNSSRLNENQYEGLNLIIKLLRCYPTSTIYVAGFTDNIGTRIHKKLMSTAQAEAMLTFIWANDIKAKLLQAEGYGDKYDVSDNKIIHGSAQNRRVEIQWISSAAAPPANAPIISMSDK